MENKRKGTGGRQLVQRKRGKLLLQRYECSDWVNERGGGKRICECGGAQTPSFSGWRGKMDHLAKRGVKCLGRKEEWVSRPIELHG